MQQQSAACPYTSNSGRRPVGLRLTCSRCILCFCQRCLFLCLCLLDTERAVFGEDGVSGGEAGYRGISDPTYTVRYWMGRATEGSTSRRDRTLRMDMELLERVRRKPVGRWERERRFSWSQRMPPAGRDAVFSRSAESMMAAGTVTRTRTRQRE